jgi:ATP-dependent RNA helicase DDX60
LSKVYRLMVSRIPGITLSNARLTIDLVGHFPITTTLVSRLLQILTPTEEGSYGTKAVRGLLEQSRVSFGSDHTHQQVLHHFRFSIEYLLRQNLVNSVGNSVALAGLINHLYFTEPSNFALAVLLRSGVFHRICGNFDPSKPDPQVLISMVHVLTHLFGRRIRKQTDSEQMREIIKRSSSRVILEPLPEDAVSVLTKHNAEVVEIYRSYAIEFGRTQFNTDEKTLPMSRLAFETAVACNSPMIDSIQSTAIQYDARSAFVALSGHGDGFDTIVDLARNTREGILIESEAVPSMDDFINPPILDAYILDFFKHGQVDALVNGNGISRGDVWYLLDGFDRILGAIDESLKLVANGVELDFAGNDMNKSSANPDAYTVWEEDDEDPEGEEETDMLSLEDKRVCAAFSALRVEFHLKFKKMWA